MVMEASPSPQSVGREFVRQYYTLLNKAPAHLHRFYNNYSSFVHGGMDAANRETLPVIGQKQIHNRIQQLNFRDCHAKISQVDAQATLGSGVVVQVTGELSNDGAPMRRFTQTFVLGAQSPKKYYVHNDIFRYQDIVFSEEEGEGSGRSEGEEEGAGGATGGYFAGGFPAPPAHLAPLSPPPLKALLMLNGHPPLMEDTQRHAPATHAAPQAESVEVEEPAPPPTEVSPPPPLEPEPELEPEREPTPPPRQPLVSMPQEPKTYANLLKSGGGGGGGGAPRGSPPAPVFAPAPVPAPLCAPLDQRPRQQRGAPPAQGESGRDRDRDRDRDREQREGVSREYREHRERGSADVGGGSGGGGGAPREPRPARYSDAHQLFLGNLPHAATEDSLRALFARFGPVAELRVHSKGDTRHPNYGFITYEHAHHAQDCLATALYFPPDSPDGVKLNVEEKKARGREPPRRRVSSGHRAPPAPHPRPPHRR